MFEQMMHVVKDTENQFLIYLLYATFNTKEVTLCKSDGTEVERDFVIIYFEELK